jgi:hypothetical protein
MATIHHLSSPTKRQAAAKTPATRPATTTGAEIILFPGVRYERWCETHSQGPGRDLRAPQRDRLDVAE